MSSCRPEARSRTRTLADVLEMSTAVLEADVLDPDTGPEPRWTVEISLRPCYQEVPSRVLEMLADHGADQLHARQRGPTMQTLVTVD